MAAHIVADAFNGWREIAIARSDTFWACGSRDEARPDS